MFIICIDEIAFYPPSRITTLLLARTAVGCLPVLFVAETIIQISSVVLIKYMEIMILD
jgi:hypothetical protein